MKRILLTNFHPHQGGGGGHARYILTILQSELRKDFEFGVAAPEGSAGGARAPASGGPPLASRFRGTGKGTPPRGAAVGRSGATPRRWAPRPTHGNGPR